MNLASLALKFMVAPEFCKTFLKTMIIERFNSAKGLPIPLLTEHPRLWQTGPMTNNI